MRRMPRIALLSLLVLAAPALSGCANFDPDSLDIFGLNEKKKLPGERRDLFPEGVPGVSQGIPPEYRMGAQQPAAEAAPAVPVEAAPQQAAPTRQPAKPKPRTVRRTAPKPPAAAAAPVAPRAVAGGPRAADDPATGSVLRLAGAARHVVEPLRMASAAALRYVPALVLRRSGF